MATPKQTRTLLINGTTFEYEKARFLNRAMLAN